MPAPELVMFWFFFRLSLHLLVLACPCRSPRSRLVFSVFRLGLQPPGYPQHGSEEAGEAQQD